MLLGAGVIQWSAAIMIGAFSALGPGPASAWRFLIGATVLLLLTRPKLGHWTLRQWRGVLALGASTAFMNVCFYQAISRIPLGGAVAIEYLGPFCVAAFGRRSRRHGVFVVLALAGVVALTRPGGDLHVTGALFAAGSGLGWAGYVFASQRVGGSTSGFQGLAISMSVAAVITLPLALESAHHLVADPYLLARLAIVAVMAVVFGFGAELQGLRRLSPSVAGVIMAGDPAVALLVGWLLLHQGVTAWDLVGVGAVTVAGAGVTFDTSVGESQLAQ